MPSIWRQSQVVAWRTSIRGLLEWRAPEGESRCTLTNLFMPSMYVCVKRPLERLSFIHLLLSERPRGGRGGSRSPARYSKHYAHARYKYWPNPNVASRSAVFLYYRYRTVPSVSFGNPYLSHSHHSLDTV